MLAMGIDRKTSANNKSLKKVSQYHCSSESHFLSVIHVHGLISLEKMREGLHRILEILS